MEHRRSILENLLTRQTQEELPTPRSWWAKINVEPVMLLVAISLGFVATSQPLFTYWARCIEIITVTKGYDVANASSICAHLSSEDVAFNNVVEKDIASAKIYLQIASSVPTLIMAPVIGTWSDKRGRKNPLLYTMFGFFVYTLFQLLATLTYEYINIYYWFFAAELMIGFTGGIGCIFGTALAIVTDDCRSKLKPGSSTVPIRIGIASFVQSIGTLLGTLGTSLLAVHNNFSVYEHKFSYISAASIQVAFGAFSLIYAYVMVRETHFPLNDVYLYNRLDSRLHNHPSPSGSGDIHVQQPKSLTTKLKDNIISLAQVLLQKRPGWTRCCLIMSLFFVMVEFLALDTSLLFLLVKRQPFSWSDKVFSYFSLLRGLLFSLGMVICPLLLTLVHWLGKDSLMILVGIGASAASFFLISQAHTTEEIFLTSVFALLCGAIGPGYRSFLPRMVAKEQTARLLTVVSMIMAFCPMLSALMFNSIFNASIEWWPGFAFFVGGVLQLLVVFGQGSIHILMRPQWLLEKRIKSQLTSHNLTIGGESGRDGGGIATTSTVESDLHHGALEEQRSTSFPR